MDAELRLLIMIALFSAAYRMDEQYRPTVYKADGKNVTKKYKYDQYIRVSPALKAILIFKDKKQRDKFLIAAVCQQIFAYVWSGASVMTHIIGFNSSYYQQWIELFLYCLAGADMAIVCVIGLVYKLHK